MFTGLIEDIGKITSIKEFKDSSSSYQITIRPLNRSLKPKRLKIKEEDEEKDLTKLKLKTEDEELEEEDESLMKDLIVNNLTRIGDSISVNGACLTVIEFEFKRNKRFHKNYPNNDDEVEEEKNGLINSSFKVDLSPETLNVTNLGSLKVGDLVNLERALSSSSRFGGHFVQGHVDTTAKIIKISKEKDSKRYEFQLNPSTSSTSSSSKTSIKGEDKDKDEEEMMKREMRYLIPKGYITIDGISLTINSIKNSSRTFSINLIPHSQSKVTLNLKDVGEIVNLEFDVLVKTIVNVLIQDQEKEKVEKNDEKEKEKDEKEKEQQEKQKIMVSKEFIKEIVLEVLKETKK